MAFAKALREAGFMLEVVWDYDLCNLLTKALLKKRTEPMAPYSYHIPFSTELTKKTRGP